MAVLRGKFISVNAYVKKLDMHQVNEQTLHLTELEKQQQSNPNSSRKKEITKIREKINQQETKTTIHKNNESKGWFFQKIHKIDAPLAQLIKNHKNKNMHQ